MTALMLAVSWSTLARRRTDMNIADMLALPNKAPVLVKGGDYTYDGRVVSVFYKMRGEARCVVEDSFGRLFIHNAGQLEGIV